MSKQVSTMPAPTNTNKNETNTAKLEHVQITQQRDALQLTVRNLRKENSKLSAEVYELSVKNAAQAATMLL